MQIAGDRTLFSHTLGPDTAYPSSHVGWHVDPLASTEVQSPTAPWLVMTRRKEERIWRTRTPTRCRFHRRHP